MYGTLRVLSRGPCRVWGLGFRCQRTIVLAVSEDNILNRYSCLNKCLKLFHDAIFGTMHWHGGLRSCYLPSSPVLVTDSKLQHNKSHNPQSLYNPLWQFPFHFPLSQYKPTSNNNSNHTNIQDRKPAKCRLAQGFCGPALRKDFKFGFRA